MNKLFLFLFILTFSLPSFSYIPKFWTISSKLARSRGNKPLKVIQDVTVKEKSTGKVFTVRETLFVKNDQTYKVVLSGKHLLDQHVNAAFIYNGSTKVQNKSGSLSKIDIGNNFYLPFLYTQSAPEFRKILSQNGMVPPEALVEPKFSTFSGQNSEPPELFTHLSRTNGKISYAITKKLSTKNLVSPTVWITQDNFHLSKIRFDENHVVSFSGYKEFQKKVWLPQFTLIQLEDKSIKISTVSVKILSKQEVNNELNTNSLLSETPKLNFNNSTLETFYSVYR